LPEHENGVIKVTTVIVPVGSSGRGSSLITLFVASILILAGIFVFLHGIPFAESEDKTLDTVIEILYKDGSKEVLGQSVLPLKLFHNDKEIQAVYVKPVVRFYYVGEISSVTIDYKVEVRISSKPGEFVYNSPVTVIIKTNSYTPLTVSPVETDAGMKAEVHLPAVEFTASELENAVLQKWGRYSGDIPIAFYVTATVKATFTDGTTDSASATGYTIVTFNRPPDGDLKAAEVSVDFQVSEVLNSGGGGGGAGPGDLLPIDNPYMVLGSVG